jgi:hypothetical protein
MFRAGFICRSSSPATLSDIYDGILARQIRRGHARAPPLRQHHGHDLLSVHPRRGVAAVQTRHRAKLDFDSLMLFSEAAASSSVLSALENIRPHIRISQNFTACACSPRSPPCSSSTPEAGQSSRWRSSRSSRIQKSSPSISCMDSAAGGCPFHFCAGETSAGRASDSSPR